MKLNQRRLYRHPVRKSIDKRGSQGYDCFIPTRELEITKRLQGMFVVQAKRWVVEITFG